MTIYRYKTSWIGALPGLPGYTFMYLTGANLAASQIAGFWGGIAALFPLQLKWHVDPTIVLIDETTGKMTGTQPTDAPADVAATGSSNYVAQAGAQVKLNTGDFVNGRHVVGRWFLVPLTTPQFSTNGLIATAATGAISSAVANLASLSGQTFCVWARPLYKKAPVAGDPPVLFRPGSKHFVTSSSVPSKSVTLNSRRD